MPSNTQLTVIRTVATAVVTALATLQVLYPSYTWIAAATAAFATLGIHAIPSIQQKGNTVSDNGLTAMGLQPAEQVQAQPVQETAPVTEAPETPVPVVMSNPVSDPLPSPVATPEEVSTAARQALTDAANALLKIAETL